VQEGADPGDVLQPFLTVLDGRVVPYNDLVSAGAKDRACTGSQRLAGRSLRGEPLGLASGT
jgi:hypothetical protein